MVTNIGMVQLNIGNARSTFFLDLLHGKLRLPTTHRQGLRPLVLLLRLFLHFLRVLRVLRAFPAFSSLPALLPRLGPLPEVVLVELLGGVDLPLTPLSRPHLPLELIHSDGQTDEDQQLQRVGQQVAGLPQHLRAVRVLQHHQKHALHDESAGGERDASEKLPLPSERDGREDDGEDDGQESECEIEIAVG